MRKGVKTAIVGGVFVVMVGGAGYGAYNFLTALNEGTSSGSSVGGPAPVKTGPPSTSEVKEASAKFLAAWQKGDAAAAASYTNNAGAARAVADRVRHRCAHHQGAHHADRTER